MDSEIQDLTNALDVFSYMADFRTASMDDIVAEYNAVKNNNVVSINRKGDSKNIQVGKILWTRRKKKKLN